MSLIKYNIKVFYNYLHIVIFPIPEHLAGQATSNDIQNNLVVSLRCSQRDMLSVCVKLQTNTSKRTKTTVCSNQSETTN